MPICSISEIAIGDEVQSWNFAAGRIAANRVSRLHRFDADGYLKINDLEVTGKHPFAVAENVWAEAEAMTTDRQQILALLARHRGEIASRFGVRSLGLFGSAARDELVPASDVDVLVEFEDPG